MNIVSFITEPRAIRRILDHIKGSTLLESCATTDRADVTVSSALTALALVATLNLRHGDCDISQAGCGVD